MVLKRCHHFSGNIDLVVITPKTSWPLAMIRRRASNWPLWRICFLFKILSANSFIPARLGVRWYNTTRYTLKYLVSMQLLWWRLQRRRNHSLFGRNTRMLSEAVESSPSPCKLDHGGLEPNAIAIYEEVMYRMLPLIHSSHPPHLWLRTECGEQMQILAMQWLETMS